MNKKILTTPLSDEAIRELNIGDIVYLTGDLVTARDAVHHRLLDLHMELPLSLDRKAIFHAGPIMKEAGSGQYEVISVGPTTSMRMEKLEKEFLEKTGVKLIIGKGGMGEKTAEGCMESTAVHAVIPGGCAVLAAKCVERVEAVFWKDLGMPEALWVMKVKEFGPLVISIDSKGRNLFENNKKAIMMKKDGAVEEICQHVGYIQ